MRPLLLKYLCDPVDKSDLRLVDPIYDSKGDIVEGSLISKGGRMYPVINGIPRFLGKEDLRETVESFGNEWNYFNFNHFKLNWLNHTVKNTFGSTDVFAGKLIVDAGAGSGMQSYWMSQTGANHVISLELSHSVDGVIKKNLMGVDNVDVIQCSIDCPPIKDGSIGGIVICHNVIQHTPSVQNTAHALWNIVGEGGEFVFNCYGKNDEGFIRKIRFELNRFLRAVLSKMPFRALLFYSKVMSILRFIPLFGLILEKSNLMFRGEVIRGGNYFQRAYMAGGLNTFDWFGSHSFQHYVSDEDIVALVADLQPDRKKVLNVDEYFLRPPPIGCALRLLK